MNKLLIGGKEFVVKRPTKNKLELATIMEHLHRRYLGRTIYECYDRPSNTKVDIYYHWKEWSDNTEGVLYFEISSYNSQQFTLSALYHDVEHEAWYQLSITKCNLIATYIEN